MFQRFRASWALTKTCFNVLKQDKELMLFPVLSSLLTVLVACSFIVPGYFAALKMQDFSAGQIKLFAIPATFLFYFATTAVVLFCNTALLSCAKKRFEGGDPTFMDGIRAGFSNLKPILAWAALGGVVGVILKQIEENLGFLGTIITRFLGGAWAVITYFALPVMIFEGVGPRDAITRSKAIISKTWGEALGAYLGLSALTSIFCWLTLLVLIGSTTASIMMSTAYPMGIALAVILVSGIAVAIVSSCLAHIFQAALYVYATTNELPSGFEPEVMKSAFMPKQGRKWVLVKAS